MATSKEEGTWQYWSVCQIQVTSVVCIEIFELKYWKISLGTTSFRECDLIFPSFPIPFVTINQAAFKIHYNSIVTPAPLNQVANLSRILFLAYSEFSTHNQNAHLRFFSFWSLWYYFPLSLTTASSWSCVVHAWKCSLQACPSNMLCFCVKWVGLPPYLQVFPALFRQALVLRISRTPAIS